MNSTQTNNTSIVDDIKYFFENGRVRAASTDIARSDRSSSPDAFNWHTVKDNLRQILSLPGDFTASSSKTTSHWSRWLSDDASATVDHRSPWQRSSNDDASTVVPDQERLRSDSDDSGTSSASIQSEKSCSSCRYAVVRRVSGDGTALLSRPDDGFVHVNQWWQRCSTRPCSYTEVIYVHSSSTDSDTSDPGGGEVDDYCCSSCHTDPPNTTMDIFTGHIVLTYMEDHLQNKGRLDAEWEALCAYEPETNGTTAATQPCNIRKNRISTVLPYDHNRVRLKSKLNVSGGDYINASTITDHDPRRPTYIATQGPLPHTVADFWQMVWENECVVIVNLTNMAEHNKPEVTLCHQYWPEQGSDLYHVYEVHLVSEHISSDDYVVRSFYLKNVQSGDTRTVTQYHFQTWPQNCVPVSSRSLLNFRRKVNKSYKGLSCPIVVHCSDGAGRSGTFCLIDMVLNRLVKGAKEIDISATLEHFRDQRMRMVTTKEQFEFALTCVAEEVYAILKALHT